MGARSTGRIDGALVLRSLRSIPQECQRRAELGKAHAEGIAPVLTGRYKTGMPVVRDAASGGGFRVREIEHASGVRGARLSNDARSPRGFLYALALERGTRYMRARHILGQSIDAMRGR